MKPNDSGRGVAGARPAFLTVRDPLAGRLLSDHEWVDFLAPFLARESGVAEASRELGEPLERVRYRVRRLVEAGVLEVVREVPRTGRPIRIYRSVADGFVVPFEASPYGDLEERLRASLHASDEIVARAAARALREVGVEGRRIYRAPDGEVHQEADVERADVLEASGVVVEALSVDVRLPRERARALLRDLNALVDRARAEADAAEHARAEGRGLDEGPVRRYRVAYQIAPHDE